MAKHMAQRMCVGCRQMNNKSDLIRIVIDNDALMHDIKQKKLSRGIYVCKNRDCILLTKKKKVFSKFLKKQVFDEFYEELLEYAK